MCAASGKRCCAESEPAMPFSENLRSIRLEKGLTQQYLADALGVTRSTVAAYECGRIEPSIEKILILSSSLGASLDELMR